MAGLRGRSSIYARNPKRCGSTLAALPPPGAMGYKESNLNGSEKTMSRLQFCMSASVLAVVTATIFTVPAAAQRVDPSTIYLYQGADRDQRLLEAAKKEGTLTFYTSMQTP